MKHGKLKHGRTKKTKPGSGVDYHAASGKFRARISVLGSRFEIGFYPNREEADNAVASARKWIAANGKENFATEFKPE